MPTAFYRHVRVFSKIRCAVIALVEPPNAIFELPTRSYYHRFIRLYLRASADTCALQGMCSMLKLIIEKELLTRFYDATFVIACILSAMLIFLSFYLSVRNYSDLVNDYNGIQELNRNSLKAQETYEDIDSEGIGISKPPEVLSIFSVGIANYIGRNLNVNSYSTPQLYGSKVEGNPIFAIFGDLDMTFVVKSILSLLAIVFSYNMLSGEKEGGTLRLIASFPVPRDTLILGKLVGGLFSLFIPLLVPTLLSMAVLLLLPSIHFESDDYLRLIFIFGIFLLYLTLFFLIGAFISARTKSSSVSFLITLFIWMLVVLIIPKSSSILAAQFVHVPSIQQHRIQKEQVREDIFEKFSQKFDQIRPNVGLLHEDSQMVWEEYNKKTKELDQRKTIELAEAQARMDREYQQQQQNLVDLAIMLSRISPAATMTHAAMGFANTDVRSFDHFIRYARVFRERFIAIIEEKAPHSRRSFFTMDDLKVFEMKREKPNVNEIPVFKYEKMLLASVLQATLIDILLLVLLCLLLFIFTYVSFLKYDVR